MAARLAVLLCLVALLVTLPARAGAVDPAAPQPAVPLLTAFSGILHLPSSVGGTQTIRSTHRKLLGDNRIQSNCRRIYSRWCP
jgi:hypothetical protein